MCKEGERLWKRLGLFVKYVFVGMLVLLDDFSGRYRWLLFSGVVDVWLLEP